ncbi:MAG: trigger factor [Candidatus Nanopelagicales bacterium]|jgi:trigger factor|nr:trigger factor [Candidatus Nanopelagicales bacterium]MDP4824824.1 trigger factor [Candidatus Nanopelagicales bacterium]MDP4887398.1 trigger factor [Candidatus Nanopelagicales bacterium]
MKTSVETLSPTRVKLTVEIPFAEMSQSVEAAYRTIAEQVTIPGFRKGKVPSSIIDQRVGRGAVLQEAINEVIPDAYENAVKETKVKIASQPEIEVTKIEDGELLEFTAEVDIRPEFDLPDFATIEVEVDDIKVGDEGIDEELSSLRRRFATLVPVEREAVDGDLLLVDLSGTNAAGDDVEDLSAAAMSVELGDESILPGFDEALRGAKAGQTRTFEFVPSAGEYADQPITVSVMVSTVRERELPEPNDEFAMLASEFDTLEELRADIGERMERVKRMEQAMEARGKVHDAMLELLDIPVPEGIIDAEVSEHFTDGHGDDAHREEFISQTRDRIKSQFILDRIAEDEVVSVGESELSAWVIQQAPRYQMAPDALLSALVQGNQLPVAIADIRRGKALALVTSRATVTDASGAIVDLEALDAQLRAAEAAGEVEVVDE